MSGPGSSLAPVGGTAWLRDARLIAAATSARILATPVIMALVMAPGASDGAAGVLFAVVAATDWIDGRLARRWGVTSRLGSFLDTTADKLLVTGVLVALVSVDRVSPWLAALIVARELLVLGLRAAVAGEGVLIAPSRLAKVKTAIQFLAIELAILRLGSPVGGLYVDEWAMLAAALVTVASAVDYLRRFGGALTL